MRIWLSAISFCLVIFFEGCTPPQPVQEKSTAVDSTALYLEELNQSILDHERDPVLYNQRAKLFLREKEFDKALKDINKAISLDDKNPDYYITLSDIQLLLGQTENCLTALNRAAALDPEGREARLKMAQLFLILRNYTATFRVINELLSLDAYNPRAYFLRAIAYMEQGDTAKAVGDLMKAVDQDQLYIEAYMQLGELFSLRNDPLAEGYLLNALRVQPDNKEALYMLGMYYQNTGQYEKALQTYNRLSVAAPGFRNALYNKGYIYLVYLTDFPKAIEAFTDAIRIDPDYTDAYFNRGYAYELNHQPDLAYKDYKTTLKLDVNNSRAIEGLNRLDQAGYVR
ncbi:MAG: tetratricopeptide repeat protein [Bacteroidales bacterium]|nr:tetratricopeptide repeat protein [Bacteroidales bacterium]